VVRRHEGHMLLFMSGHEWCCHHDGHGHSFYRLTVGGRQEKDKSIRLDCPPGVEHFASKLEGSGGDARWFAKEYEKAVAAHQGSSSLGRHGEYLQPRGAGVYQPTQNHSTTHMRLPSRATYELGRRLPSRATYERQDSRHYEDAAGSMTQTTGLTRSAYAHQEERHYAAAAQTFGSRNPASGQLSRNSLENTSDTRSTTGRGERSEPSEAEARERARWEEMAQRTWAPQPPQPRQFPPTMLQTSSINEAAEWTQIDNEIAALQQQLRINNVAPEICAAFRREGLDAASWLECSREELQPLSLGVVKCLTRWARTRLGLEGARSQPSLVADTQEAASPPKHAKLVSQGLRMVHARDLAGRGAHGIARAQRHTSKKAQIVHRLLQSLSGPASGVAANAALFHATSAGEPVQVSAGSGTTPQACKFYISAVDLQKLADADRRTCRKPNCVHDHSAATSKANCDRLLRRARKKIAAQDKANRKRPVPTDVERRGHIQTYDSARGYGHIMPSARDHGGNHRRQRIYFHVRDWTGIGVPCVGAAVRYIRVNDTRAHGKWKATNVSFLGGQSVSGARD
jgi:hypothetical protein